MLWLLNFQKNSLENKRLSLICRWGNRLRVSHKPSKRENWQRYMLLFNPPYFSSFWNLTLYYFAVKTNGLSQRSCITYRATLMVVSVWGGKGGGQWLRPLKPYPCLFPLTSFTNSRYVNIWKQNWYTEEQTWFHIGSLLLALTLVLCCLCLVMLALHLCKRTLPVAWNIHDNPFQGSDFQAWPLKVKHLPTHRETKSCKTENNNV